MEIILIVGTLLAAGFALSRLAKLLHLPSIIGYIIAGILMGPSGLGIISGETTENRFDVFTHIALMLVAFSIGERFDLRELRSSAKALMKVSAAEIITTFVFSGFAVSAAILFTFPGSEEFSLEQAAAVGIICAAIAVATAPASTVAVIKELGARGPVSRLALSDIVVNNAFSVILFGIMTALAHELLGTGLDSGIGKFLFPFSQSLMSLVLGVAVGFACDFAVHRLTGRDDVLVISLASVLLVGGLAGALGLSSLLAGVAAGFTVVNRDRRDVRAFRALNDFEPPIYGLFFALAGAGLHLNQLLTAGSLGIIFVAARGAGKYFGARIGGNRAGLSKLLSHSVGLSLFPQAGIAVGLAYLVQQDSNLAPIQALVINLVMASVVINELIGAPLVRYALVKSGEVKGEDREWGQESTLPKEAKLIKDSENTVGISEWPQKPLSPAERTRGHSLIALSHTNTSRALTRLGALTAHYYGACPMAVHVVKPEEKNYWAAVDNEMIAEIFSRATEEARIMGYKLHTEVEFAEEIAEGILRNASEHEARIIVLGYPESEKSRQSEEFINRVVEEAEVPVIVARFKEALAGGRILVPLAETGDLDIVRPVVRSLGLVSSHTITLLRLMPPESGEEELRAAERELQQVCTEKPMESEVTFRAVAAESRTHQIIKEAEDFSVLAMAIRSQGKIRQALFGSMAQEVADNVPITVIFVYGCH